MHFVADKLVLGLTSRAAWHDSVSGGKASSLAQMVQMQLREAQIPQGIVVTTMAFNKHLRQNPDLKLKLEALEDLSHRVSAKVTQKSELESFCERYSVCHQFFFLFYRFSDYLVNCCKFSILMFEFP